MGELTDYLALNKTNRIYRTLNIIVNETLQCIINIAIIKIFT